MGIFSVTVVAALSGCTATTPNPSSSATEPTADLSVGSTDTTPDTDTDTGKPKDTGEPVDTGDPVEPRDEAKYRLGQLLFFDRELSGSRDLACSSCHLPDYGLGDGMSFATGPGSVGLGPDRTYTGEPLEGRNAQPVFNLDEIEEIFWDGVVYEAEDGSFNHIHADELALPAALENAVAAQAMLPVAQPAEMRGYEKTTDVFGNPNELGDMDQKDTYAIWDAIMARVLAFPEYVKLFAEVYPDVAEEDLSFAHAANAIAYFELEAFQLKDSPYDRHLAGEKDALTDAQLRGLAIFEGKAGCVDCHSGPALTDNGYHNVLAPQVGPGRVSGDLPNDGRDLGRWRVTGLDADKYAFRTPSLRNVAETGPWTHAGAYTTLEAAVRHMLDPGSGFDSYDPTQLREDIQDQVYSEEKVLKDMRAALSPKVTARTLTDDEFDDLMAFLGALTDPAIHTLAASVTPKAVPSGLPVDGQK